MEIEVKAPVEIPDGNHKGQITKILYRTEPYDYTDIYLSVEGHEGIEIKFGCPSNVSKTSKLGRVLVSFGVNLVPGNKVDPEKLLVGRKCSYMTLKKSKEGREFSEVVEDSLKPLD